MGLILDNFYQFDTIMWIRFFRSVLVFHFHKNYPTEIVNENINISKFPSMNRDWI
jgi:hypothetical protein